MLNFKAIFCVVCLSITILFASEAPQNQGYSSRFYTTIKQWLERTPLVPGWRTTPEQKEKARIKLASLLIDKDILKTELTENSELTYEQIKEKENQIALIEKNINEQKVILGEEWSNRRKIVANTAKIITGITLGVMSLGLGYHLVSLTNPNPVDPYIALKVAQSLKTHNDFVTKNARFINLPFTQNPGFNYEWKLATSQQSEQTFIDIHSQDKEKTLFYDANISFKQPAFTLYACSPAALPTTWHKVITLRPYDNVITNKVEFASGYTRYITIKP